MKKFNKRAIFHLLKTFNRQELREFGNFLTFRGKHKLATMWNCLRERHPRYDIEDGQVYETVRQGKAFNDSAFRVMVADLYSMAKEYVAYLQFRGDKYQHNNTLALALLFRGEEHTFKKVQRDAKRLYGDGQIGFVELFYSQFQMEDFSYQYTTMFEHRKVTGTLQNAANCLDAHLLASKLKYLVVMHNRSRITGEEHDYWMEEEIVAFLNKQPPNITPIIHLYFLLLKLHRDMENLVLFKDFIHYFEQNKEKINIPETRQLLTFAINIAFWNIRLGNLDYLPLRFALNKIMVEGKIALVNGRYPSYHFRNIIRSAILAGEVDWAARFLLENSSLTKRAERENLETFCLAFLHFARGEYELQDSYMRKMEENDYKFVDGQINAVYRLLAIKTAYEKLGEKPTSAEQTHFKSLMNALRQYLPRNKDISAAFLLSCKNFHKAMNLVFQFHYGKGKGSKEELIANILALQPMAELPWLLGKVV